MATAAPRKYIKVNGVMALNPEFKAWKDRQGGVQTHSVVDTAVALPIVSNMDDYESFNVAATAGGGKEFQLSDSTNATIEMMQEPEISLEAGMTPDTMVDQLGAILSKYEVPMGLMNKLMMLSEFDCLEFIIDDSGSMNLESDTKGPDGRFQTRWMEAKTRLKEMVEIIAYLPFMQISIAFLNRPDKLILSRQGRNPQMFLFDAYSKIEHVFSGVPAGSTPALEKLRESFAQGRGKNIARYFFGDGIPNGGETAQQEITHLLVHRQNPQDNPVTFISVTNDDEAVEWMKEAEEAAPYCSECDDYEDEAREVLKDQGAALPFSKGFHLVCSLVAAMNPDDLDAMDESIPMTKTTLDNLLGVKHNEECYRHYFNCFTEAQRVRVFETDEHGMPKKSDQWKKTTTWSYPDFLTTPIAHQIPQVQEIKAQLKHMVG